MSEIRSECDFFCPHTVFSRGTSNFRRGGRLEPRFLCIFFSSSKIMVILNSYPYRSHLRNQSRCCQLCTNKILRISKIKIKLNKIKKLNYKKNNHMTGPPHGLIAKLLRWGPDSPAHKYAPVFRAYMNQCFENT